MHLHTRAETPPSTRHENENNGNQTDIPARPDLALPPLLPLLNLFPPFKRLRSNPNRLLLLLHLLPRLLVQLGTPRSARSHTRPDQCQKCILRERLETVFFDRGELGGAGVVA